MTTSRPSPVIATYEQRSWALSELVPEPTPEVVAGRLAEVEEAVARFESRRGELRPEMDGAILVELLDAYEELAEKTTVLAAYGSLWFAADTQSQPALTYRNRIEQALIGFENRILFFTLWWKGLDDEAAARLLRAVEGDADREHFLRDLRRLKPFTLEERAEQIVNLKDTNGVDAVLTLYSMLTNRLEFRLDVHGETRSLTRDELMSYVYSHDPELRAGAYQELLRVFEGEARILSQIYVHRVRDWHSEQVELRGYPSAIDVRHQWNDIPADAVEALLDVSRENVGLFQRYFRLKAGWLGMDRLRRYDLYAPLTRADRTIPYGEAVRKVLKTFHDFHPRFAALAERVFTDNHVDSEIRKGKKGGAFCATVVPRLTPWLLINYTGRVRDVATLAHELGHAVHSLLAAEHSILTQNPTLPLAETASVFGEMLMTDRLLREEKSPQVRRELLAAAVDDMYATVMRQAYFVRFELAAHEAILAGESPEDLNRIYLENLTEQFGDSVDPAPEFRLEWIAIPHLFHTPFYCYAYSFGQLLVLSLYRRYQEEGEAFVAGYLKLLAYGGSARPQQILTEVGVDVTDRDFWRGGFGVIAALVDELETIQT